MYALVFAIGFFSDFTDMRPLSLTTKYVAGGYSLISLYTGIFLLIRASDELMEGLEESDELDE